MSARHLQLGRINVSHDKSDVHVAKLHAFRMRNKLVKRVHMFHAGLARIFFRYMCNKEAQSSCMLHIHRGGGPPGQKRSGSKENIETAIFNSFS